MPLLLITFLEQCLLQTAARGLDYKRRILVAKEQANDAVTLTTAMRLKIYSFIARYKGPITTSARGECLPGRVRNKVQMVVSFIESRIFFYNFPLVQKCNRLKLIFRKNFWQNLFFLHWKCLITWYFVDIIITEIKCLHFTKIVKYGISFFFLHN